MDTYTNDLKELDELYVSSQDKFKKLNGAKNEFSANYYTVIEKIQNIGSLSAQLGGQISQNTEAFRSIESIMNEISQSVVKSSQELITFNNEFESLTKLFSDLSSSSIKLKEISLKMEQIVQWFK